MILFALMDSLEREEKCVLQAVILFSSFSAGTLFLCVKIANKNMYIQ